MAESAMTRFDVVISGGSFAGLALARALAKALGKFSDRFEHAEGCAAQNGQGLRELDPAQLDALWQEAKRALS